MWYEDEAQADAGLPTGFQLCYDKTGQERALTWRRGGSLPHEAVDAGEVAGRARMAPVLCDGGQLQEEVIETFREQSSNMHALIVTLVCAEGEIPGTDLFIPFNAVEANLDRLPRKDAPVALYCRSGSMSTAAARTLVSLGYSNVMELDGGFNPWKRAGLPLARNR